MSSTQQNDSTQQQHLPPQQQQQINPTIPISVSLNSVGGLRPQTITQTSGGATTFILNPSPGSTTTTNIGPQLISGGNFVHHQQQQINPMIGAPILNPQQQFRQNQPQQMVMVKTEIPIPNQNNIGTFNSLTPVTTNAHLQQTNTFTVKTTNNVINNNVQQKIDNEITDKNSNNNNDNINESKSPVPPTALPPPIVALDKQRLKELVEQVDPNEQLEEEVEDVLLSLADDFIESLISQACMLAKHRKSNHLDVKDVQLALDMNWNMWIPGFGVDGVVGVYSGGIGSSSSSSNFGQQQQISMIGSNNNSNISGNNNNTGNNANINSTNNLMNHRGPKKCMITEAHKQRLALIKKIMKKF